MKNPIPESIVVPLLRFVVRQLFLIFQCLSLANLSFYAASFSSKSSKNTRKNNRRLFGILLSDRGPLQGPLEYRLGIESHRESRHASGRWIDRWAATRARKDISSLSVRDKSRNHTQGPSVLWRWLCQVITKRGSGSSFTTESMESWYGDDWAKKGGL